MNPNQSTKSNRLIGIKSKYKGVYYKHLNCGMKNKWVIYYKAKSAANKAYAEFDFTDEGERQAAIAYDRLRIEYGLEPVNILKRCKVS